ncbi:hypothetical protein SAMN03080610_01204 [Afifella marina DSM 2698]|uniref:Uncharacterized protein n=1 Tax=Afifella marina DSM 2698 TaxID=1120955 RepID=A0A1G5MZJ1_AFIMA|nr:hypothetical protein SAMN03080610_01204 [Afifella marina DSM 2698]
MCHCNIYRSNIKHKLVYFLHGLKAMSFHGSIPRRSRIVAAIAHFERVALLASPLTPGHGLKYARWRRATRLLRTGRSAFADRAISDPDIKAAMNKRKEELAISPDAIARAIAFAIDQPEDVEIGSIVVRPTAQD